MLQLIELLAGIGLAAAVIAGGWLAVSVILKSSGTGSEVLTARLGARSHIN